MHTDTSALSQTAGSPSRRRGNAPRPRSRRRTRRVVASIVAIVFAALWFFPVYWMINSSLLEDDELTSSTPVLFPVHATADHYVSILGSSAFWSAMRMSASIAVIVVVGSIVFAAFAALSISRFRFRSRTSLIVAILIIQMIPAETVFVSQYRMLDSWDLLNSVVGTSLIYLGTNVPFTVWLLKGFVDGVPVELEEAAMLDGCSRMGAFFRITFPLVGSGIVASSIFAFLAAWNEYTLALVLLTSGGSQTLPLWITSFSGMNQNTDWGGIMAGSTLMALPVIVLFVLVQRNMVAGLTAGSVK